MSKLSTYTTGSHLILFASNNSSCVHVLHLFSSLLHFNVRIEHSKRMATIRKHITNMKCEVCKIYSYERGFTKFDTHRKLKEMMTDRNSE